MKTYTEEQVREAFREGERKGRWSIEGSFYNLPLTEDEFIGKLNKE